MRNPFEIKYYIMAINTYNWHTKFRSYLTSYSTHKVSDFIPDTIKATSWHFDPSFKKLMTKEEAEKALKEFIDTDKESNPRTKWYIKKKLCWRGFRDET